MKGRIKAWIVAWLWEALELSKEFSSLEDTLRNELAPYGDVQDLRNELESLRRDFATEEDVNAISNSLDMIESRIEKLEAA